jgi:hypothetical protein
LNSHGFANSINNCASAFLGLTGAIVIIFFIGL